ncbi:hypothetical protein [Streptomyces sp. NBC_00827]|uniref:hypothetical protein n=1 Tax=Streptomyces sp. NBC_00827 TaxID=2903677 RepID=UPI00386FE1DB|nr:hypothetical protein OG569_14630 [Streptomyces sp. NBC_00827]
MKRRSLPVAAALAAAASLLLTACGSGDDKPSDNDKIAGADQSGAEESVSPSASALETAERPKITLAEDMENVFEGGKTGDAVKDAILYDNTQAVSAMDEAIYTRSLQKASFGAYMAGDAARDATVWVQGFYDDGITWTGKVRYYNREITSLEKNVATLTYCSDESKSFNKNLKTGKTSGAVSDPEDYVVFYNTHLQKDAKGIWQMTDLISKRGASQCQ